MTKYNDAAIKAAEAGLQPASIDATAKLFNELGVSRQAAWVWRSGKGECPASARMAAAWIIKQKSDGARGWMDDNRHRLLAAVAAVNDVGVFRRVAEIVGLGE
jgi:hypothetical protein